MALCESDPSELLDAPRAGGDLDVVLRSVEMVLQALIEADVTELIGAGPHERTDGRSNQRSAAACRRDGRGRAPRRPALRMST